MLKVLSTSSNMHHILSSIILFCFLTFSVTIHPVISAVNSKPAYDGSVESSTTTEIIPAFKDIVYSPELNLSARLYLPQDTTVNQKLPLLFYIHGGGFYSGSPFDSVYNNFFNTLVPEANVIAISIQYRLTHVCTLPCAYDDSWAALKWVASHLNGDGPEFWLNQYADFQQVYLSGDSAGANIAHQMAIKLGAKENLKGFSVAGMILCHPYFWGSELLPGETPRCSKYIADIWKKVSPDTSIDDPWLNPANDPNLAWVAFPRLQVFVSENDGFQLRERGWYYAQKLRQSGWSGYLEVIDFQGERHGFHLLNPTSRNSTILRNRIVAFINFKENNTLVRMKPSTNWSHPEHFLSGLKSL